MNRIILLAFSYFTAISFVIAQDLQPDKGKLIFSVEEQKSYILMDDTLEVKNGEIFTTDTGIHKVEIWAPKHDVLSKEFVVKNDVHLNREFIDLEKGEAFKKRRNSDIMVGVAVGVTAPILFALRQDFEPFDLKPYEDAISAAQNEIANGNSAAQVDLQIAQEDYESVVQQNEDEKNKVDTRNAILTGVLVAETAALLGYVIYRAAKPKLQKSNPLISGLRLNPQLGLNHAGLGLGFKF